MRDTKYGVTEPRASRFIRVTLSLAGKMADRKVRARIWYPEINPVHSRSLDDDKDSEDSGGAMVSDLLSLGASYESKTDQDETPLHLAARNSRADNVWWIMQLM